MFVDGYLDRARFTMSPLCLLLDGGDRQCPGRLATLSGVVVLYDYLTCPKARKRQRGYARRRAIKPTNCFLKL